MILVVRFLKGFNMVKQLSWIGVFLTFMCGAVWAVSYVGDPISAIKNCTVGTYQIPNPIGGMININVKGFANNKCKVLATSSSPELSQQCSLSQNALNILASTAKEYESSTSKATEITKAIECTSTSVSPVCQSVKIIKVSCHDVSSKTSTTIQAQPATAESSAPASNEQVVSASVVQSTGVQQKKGGNVFNIQYN